MLHSFCFLFWAYTLENKMAKLFFACRDRPIRARNGRMGKQRRIFRVLITYKVILELLDVMKSHIDVEYGAGRHFGVG